MARRKSINAEKLINLVTSGAEQQEIMEEFSFKTSTQLKAAYVNALMATGVVTEINTRRKKPNNVPREVSINKRGTMILPKALLDDLGFKEGDSFYVKRVKDRITLALIGKS